MIPHLIGKHLLLCLVAVLEELLNHVITKDISHQLTCVRMELSKDLILFVAVCGLKLLLNEARAMLVTTEFDDMLIDILNLSERVDHLENELTLSS